MQPTLKVLAEIFDALYDADEFALVGAIVKLGGGQQMECVCSYADIGLILGRSTLWVRRLCGRMSGQACDVLQVALVDGDEATGLHRFSLVLPSEATPVRPGSATPPGSVVQ